MNATAERTPDITIEAIGSTYQFVECRHCDNRESFGLGSKLAREWARNHVRIHHGIARPAIKRIA